MDHCCGMAFQDPCRRMGRPCGLSRRESVCADWMLTFEKEFCSSFRTPYPGPEWKTRRTQSVLFLQNYRSAELHDAWRSTQVQQKHQIITSVIQDVNMSPKHPLGSYERLKPRAQCWAGRTHRHPFLDKLCSRSAWKVHNAAPAQRPAEPTSQVELSISKRLPQCLLTCQIYLSGMGLRGFPDRICRD